MNKKQMISVDKALAIVLDSIKETSAEKVPFLESAGRILCQDIVSTLNIPPVDNSAMDGYAVTQESIRGASDEQPVVLPVQGEIQAGSLYSGKVLDGSFAVGIMTGAPVPPGADAVIPVEYTKEDGNNVKIFKSLNRGDNIRRKGEDIAQGQVVLKKGRTLRSADVGLLASLNITDVMVYRRPHVAIIPTGNELVEPGDEIKNGQIRNSNAYTLFAEISKCNAVPHYMGIARDDFEETREKFRKAFESDIVITTGGVSMGKYDFVKDVMADLNIDIKIEKLLMKPGKPFVFGIKSDKLFFGLPGNPVSTMVSFIQFVRPAIRKLMGARELQKPVVHATLQQDITKKTERRHFVRGYLTIQDEEFYVSTTGPQGSGILTSMSDANCLIILPEGRTVCRTGEKVSIQLIHHEELE